MGTKPRGSVRLLGYSLSVIDATVFDWTYHALRWTWHDPDGYNFLSGPLADITLFGGAYAIFRRHNCHAKRCWRVGRHKVPGTDYIVCRKHHPHESPSAEQILAEHDAAKRALQATPAGRSAGATRATRATGVAGAVGAVGGTGVGHGRGAAGIAAGVGGGRSRGRPESGAAGVGGSASGPRSRAAAPRGALSKACRTRSKALWRGWVWHAPRVSAAPWRCT